MRKRYLLGLGAGALAAAALRRLGERSGATDDERRTGLPGDELVPEPMWTSTRAITIAAEPAAIWPWLVQMGFPACRAGWYTPHWLDRLQWGIGERSADRIRPELQELEVGDQVPDSRDGSVFFAVAALERERALVLYSTRHVLRPVRSIEFSWAFVLEPRGRAATRLLIRARVRGEPRVALLLLAPIVGAGDFLNASAMLRGIRERIELGQSSGSSVERSRRSADQQAYCNARRLWPSERRRLRDTTARAGDHESHAAPDRPPSARAHYRPRAPRRAPGGR
jgi:hypothetical protein